MSLVLKRTFIGVLLLGVLAGLLYLDFWLENSRILGSFSSILGFSLLVLFIANFTAYEIVKLVQKSKVDIKLSLTLIGVTAMILGSVFVSQILFDSINPVMRTNFYLSKNLVQKGASSLTKISDEKFKNQLIEFEDVKSISQEEFDAQMLAAKELAVKDAISIPVPKYLMILLGISMIFLFIILIKTLYCKAEYNQQMMTIVMSLFVFMLVGLPYAISIFIRTIPFFGLKLIILLIMVSRMGDAGAFFIGRAFGRIKLIPGISPKKTVEGCLGGLLTSVLMGGLLAHILNLGQFFQADSIIAGMIVGLIVGFSAQIADLFSSLLKRWANVKDSSKIIPEFGGILDLTDNFLLSLPVLYLIILIIWV